jgi:hypothetical protein
MLPERLGFWKNARTDRRFSCRPQNLPVQQVTKLELCKETMRLEASAPDAEGKDIVQYRCERCERIERVRLLRRSRAAS